MTRYRKIPVEIEAIQWTGNNIIDVMAFMAPQEPVCVNNLSHMKFTNADDLVGIQTREGLVVAGLNDWIIKGVDGELSPCKPDIFAATYEATSSQLFVEPQDVLNMAYRERAHLVALLAAWRPSHIGYTDPAAPDWAVVTIELPTGQACWHIAPADMDLFCHVRPTPDRARGWDGHDTDEKYRRVDEFAAQLAEGPF